MASRALRRIVAASSIPIGALLACGGRECPVVTPATSVATSSSSSSTAVAPPRLLAIGGGVVCFGSHDDRVFCNFEEEDPSHFHEIVVLRGAVELTPEGYGGCARMRDGHVRCWGFDMRGEVGDGAPLSKPGSFGACGPIPASFWAAASASSAKPSGSSAPVSKKPKIGGGATTSPKPASACASTTASVSAPSTASAVAALPVWHRPPLAPSMTPPLLPRGAFIGPVNIVTSPTEVVGVADAVQIWGDPQLRCALTSKGAVRCWGEGLGAEPDGSCKASSTPVTIADARVRELGGPGPCALDDEGRIDCWRRAEVGGYPVFAWQSLDHGGDVVQIASGTSAVCARREGGAVTCWGANWRRTLDGNANEDAAPITPHELFRATSVAVGGHHGCAIGDERHVLCWGAVDSGATGIGIDGDAWNAVLPVHDLHDVVQLATNDQTTCAIRSDRTLWCWGAATRLGRGDALVPVKLATLPD